MPVESWRYESRRERRRRQIAALQDSVSRSLEPFYRGDYGAARQAFRGEEPEPVEPLRFDLPEAETGEPGRRMAPGWGGAIGKITQDVAGGVREPGTLPKRDKGVGGILSKIGAAFDAVTPDALEPVGRKALEYADKPREYVGGPLFSLLTGATGVESQVDPETGQRYRSKPGFGDVLSGLGEAFTRNPIETYQEGRQAANERLADPELSAFERTLLGGFSDPLSYIGVGAVNRGLRFLPEAVRASRGFRAGAALVESPGRASAGGVIGAGLGAQFAEEAGADSRGTLLATLGGGLVGGGLASSLTPERVTRGIDRITDLEGRLTAEPELGELSMYARTGDYPQASRQIGGLEVWDEDGIPNQASIGASLGEYEVLPGIRTLPLSDFDAAPRDLFYAADDLRAVRHLAGQISESGRIKPLIVVIDAEGPYILEGAHRLGALHELGVTEFPALVVKDLEAIGPESGTLRMRPKARIGAKGALPRLRPEEVAADRALGLPDYSAADVLTLPKLEAKPRSRLQTIVDTMKSTLGMTPDDTVAAPAMRARERLKPVVESQANRLAAVADNIANTAFRRDADGRIQDIVGNPTVQHLAARLPEYEPFMTTAQKAAMARLRAEVEPYRRLLAEAGVEYGSRADVMEGGFYLPRGRADLEGADAPVGRRGGGRAGSKQGFQKGAEFETMLAGIDAGYEYAPFAEAMRSYAEQAGRAAVDKHVADYFKSLVARNASDFEGRLAGESLGSTPSDRMDPVVRARWQDLAAQLVSARARLRTLEKRAKVALTASDEVDDAIQQWEQGLPDSGTGGIARIGSALEGEAQRGQQLRQQAADMGDDYGAKLSHLSGQAYELERVVKRLDEIVPPDVDKLGKLETALRRTVKRAEQMADRGVEYRDEALKVRDEIDHILDAVDELRPEYQRALEKSRATPRGEAAIDMAPLSGMTFPEALANAANKFLKAEKPASGRNTGTLVAVQAFNQLLRGMRATADISFMGIQGAIGAARNPVAYASALHAAIRSMADGDFLGAFIRDFDADAVKRGRPTSREWAARGLRVSGNQHEFAIGRGLGAVGDRIQSLPVVKQSNRAFGNFGDALRLKLADASYGSSRMVGFDMAEAANLESVADAVNRATGWSRSRFAGDVGELAMFAPRFFQSQIEFLAQAAAGGGPGAWEARRMLLQFTGAGVMVTLLANEFSDNPIPTEELFDPTSGNFMRFRWGGQDISVFGPWDSLVRG
ncbi:MAG: ParB N-terminal domain-containing protein, partial [Vicinamibacterales bacterium]